jgi:hypothetical protein
MAHIYETVKWVGNAAFAVVTTAANAAGAAVGTAMGGVAIAELWPGKAVANPSKPDSVSPSVVPHGLDPGAIVPRSFASSFDPDGGSLDPSASSFEHGASSMDPGVSSLDPTAGSFDPGAN